ncbi:membrane fusion protein (multidrug efflux system) [Desulfobotulus alkaliphilus]|uniref:Membrane fusion protein (Multidrug efflux system) n=1 Tax=Desulfobotulus alkaliphilus TaxID=622671 RepID=A0A562S2J4_9BACT|nr:efflux RND transporter periplasmic adaptor subunit [Desulfobotulus alkaliphilus]TWI75358.1 membrane fusion protein (multidrug efflux system) [Desulfobotulus alkaliphilus]
MPVFKNLQNLRGHIVLFSILLLILAACSQPAESPQEPKSAFRPPPPAVTTLTVKERDAKVFNDYPARIHGARQVQVRARVEGILQKRLYVEGQPVREGDVLFQIDPERYDIALRRAEADLANAEASHADARREWQRSITLYEADAVSERTRDQARTALDLAVARLDLAKTAVEEARRNLRYTEVRAPLCGITGMETLSEGNLLEWGALLTTITQQDPVHVRFSLPEDDAAIQGAARRAMGKAENGDHRYEATLIFSDGAAYDRKGELDFTASTIDPRTGTVTARAVFPNPDNQLMPGQFVRIRVHLQSFKDIFMIPEGAVTQGPAGPRVFVVTDENRAVSRNVTLGSAVNGEQIILKGLERGDRVVIMGHVSVRDGMEVSPTEKRSEEAS